MTDACRRGRDIRHFPLNIGKNSQISLVGEVPPPPPYTIDQREARKIYKGTTGLALTIKKTELSD